ncbi:hypothetical protein [Thalassolituus oleivorans]|uniref:hypothetical protein n=1 Tax=Thalassolituus oleivorans TaxID=187493 RepID=UPI0023F31B02|nr:hypothetical protein [Thalassolituus oleivorans]
MFKYGKPQQNKYTSSIQERRLTIYDKIAVGDPNLWIPTSKLEQILNYSLSGVSLSGLPIRTRSKVVKERICEALGYPIPTSFKKVQPRFSGQFFDVYVQKSNNLQVWNEDLSPERRYVLIKVTDFDVISKVKVVTGQDLSLLDNTGTLTQKYQARLVPNGMAKELSVSSDTSIIAPHTQQGISVKNFDPTTDPSSGKLMPISEVFIRLQSLLGTSFPDAGHDQERNRGAKLHQLICQKLGYVTYKDNGRFPDIRQQLLEVKLQTSPTIDLGLVRPNSTQVLDALTVGTSKIRHCDVRYAIFYAKTDGKLITLTNFYLTTGEHFFTRFPQFQGRILNKKIQIPLPVNFFA